MQLDTNHFKKMLEDEKAVLEKELATVGEKNPADKNDWFAADSKKDIDRAEEGEVAENIDEYETRVGILDKLELRLGNVKTAFEKIENGSYGICKICGEKIEEDRLEANPASLTCKKHMETA